MESSSSSSMGTAMKLAVVSVLALALSSFAASACNEVERDSLTAFFATLSSPSPLDWGSSPDRCDENGSLPSTELKAMRISRTANGEIRYQNYVSHESSDFSLELLNPVLLFSGHDRDRCTVIHKSTSGPVTEHTAGTISWQQRNLFPSFTLLSVSSFVLPNTSTPEEAAIAQLYVYIRYIALFIFTLLALLLWPTSSTTSFWLETTNLLGHRKELLGAAFSTTKEKNEVERDEVFHSWSLRWSLPYMESSPSSSVVMVMKLAVVSVLALSSFAASVCNEVERDSLMAFFANLSSPAPLDWRSSPDCCDWEGIRCDENGVIGLSLPSRELKAMVFPTLTNLSRLAELNLSRNSLYGSLPTDFFAILKSLRVLDLSFNRFHGGIPYSSLSAMDFRAVDLSSNLFDGPIPEAMFSAALTTFNVSNNSLSGRIPSFCSQSPRLRFSDFSFNEFSGEIPAGIGGCSELEIFRAGFNGLVGPIPDELYDVVSLTQISLPVNKLSGPVQNGIVKLLRLQTLELFSNQLTGSIPGEIGRLKKLEKLLLHINNLTGTIPASISNLTNLSTLNLRVNALAGDISGLDFSALQLLSTLDLGNNYLAGEIPASLYKCKSLTAVRFAANNLHGQISPAILNLTSLSFLTVSNNSFSNLTGALAILKRSKTLTTLVMSKNFWHEDMPQEERVVEADEFPSLVVLGIGGCSLKGKFPVWVAKLKKLQVLDLSVNRLTGLIPGWLGSFSNLFYLDLNTNLFSGGFPVELCGLPALTSGPSEPRNYLELPVFVMPNNATNQQYNQLSNLPPAIYLSGNNLTGKIPVEIGQLKFLHVLELNNNSFSGSIPDQLSNLTNLERLDLSRNRLTGEIPSSLRGLHFLSFFSVAYNDLTGPVPSGSQFDTFGRSSFEGNPGLCGSQAVLRSCSSPATPIHRKHSKKLLAGVVAGACFGAAFIITLGFALWVFSTRRILPRGDSDKIDFDTISSNSNAVMPETDYDASIVVLFSDAVAEIKDLGLVEILKATDNFNQANIIGCGGFGLVYKATLANGTKLAIKKLSGDLGLMEREFKAEVEALSTAQHENLVSLQGYCVHDGFRILIYSYMENGSLDFWLHEKPDGPSQLDWPTRLKILQGASFGLAYMHEICEPHIVHRDIKSSNILLDEDFKAHVADFGLSRLILPYETHVTTELVGTLGYIPPEYGQAWVATLRGDMYSFGVVMLELLTGKRPVEVFKPRVSRELVAWVVKMRGEGKQSEVFDPLLRGKGFEEEMGRVLDVACMCVNHNPFKRPSIKEVVHWLNHVGERDRDNE